MTRHYKNNLHATYYFVFLLLLILQNQCLITAPFWQFRQTLERLSLMDKLLSEINGQLSHQGLDIKSGGVCIVEASVIEAKQCQPHKDKNGESTQDPYVGCVSIGYRMLRKSYWSGRQDLNLRPLLYPLSMSPHHQSYKNHKIQKLR